MGSMAGKVVIVTGAGRGLGRAFAVGFAREGARVVLVGRRSGPPDHPETLEHTAALIADAGGEALCCEGSVSDVEAMQRMAGQCVEHFGGVDVLVNNAGMHHTETFSELSFEM